ncbi:MAG TPA: hypothetical protein PLB62_05310 [Candidatus Sumerlaeota bacterium]|nr:hypothetical protein [Candidatus Sumerlaeota bacterium]
MKAKAGQIILGALLAAALILAVQALTGHFTSPFSGPAQAQMIGTTQLYTMTSSSYVITTNANGDRVFVYYFDAKPDRDKSTISFITTAGAAK